uniref:Uncharacterized protein n=1 Tax=Avena sativa TaxID=4498 RepID=A0ACD5T6P5_AVESA
MASTAALEHVLRKISAAIEQQEVLRADARITSLYEALTSFKAQVEMLQIPDLGVETSEEMAWRRAVFHLACFAEDFVDFSTCPIDDLRVDRVGKRKFREWILKAPSAVHQRITALSQAQPGYAPRSESSGPTAGCYDPCLPVPTVDSELLGVREAREKLGSFLLDGDMHLKAVSLVGFTGIGKTSLAMELYRKSEAEFECRATASVSRNPDMKQLLQHILSQVRPEAPQCSDAAPQLQQLIKEIREHLQDKRYLVLIDDVWECLTEIESALPKNNCCSRIIMTTPIKKLAELGPCGCGVTVYEMEPLGVADLENLLSRETGCRKCLNEASDLSHGVPLAAVAMARLVKERNHGENYGRQTAAPEIQRRISVSYIDLDPCHRTHMILLCMFPSNFRIESKLLVQLWKAEGYADSVSRGEDILKELIGRNVILPVNREDISQVEAWKVHYSMLEFILLHSAGDNFLITSSSKRWTAPAEKVRRLALDSNYPQSEFRNWFGKLDLSFTSSLFIFWEANRVPLNQFRHLRVLNIIGWKHLKDNDLNHICHMFLLRYLSLRNTKISNIPPIISNLCYLETLDLRKTRVTELPSQVGQLPELSDLLVGSDQDPSANARVKIPTGFRYFGSLRTLETIHLSDAWLLLDSLPHLTEIAIMCPFRESRYSQEKLCRSLKQCCGLKSLTFYGGLGCSMDFLHSLHDPPCDITKLWVTGRLVRIPRWIATLKNLVHLQIRVCQLCPGDLQNLGELQRLEHLLLGLDFLPEQEMVVTGFPTLERFSVDCRVPWLNFEPGVMPKLTELELKFREGPGNQQHSVPSGINHLVNLKRVAIYYSYGCVSSPSVQATVEAMVVAVHDHPRPVKLFINGSRCSDINGDQAVIRELSTQNYTSSRHTEPSSSP